MASSHLSMSMVIKQAIERGSSKQFKTTITDLSGNPQDPDPGTCYVRLEKTGSYNYGSPTDWYLCSSVAPGTAGVFGADIWLPTYMTLGDWLARFKWEMTDGTTITDYDSFPFTIIRRDKPYESRTGPVL